VRRANTSITHNHSEDLLVLWQTMWSLNIPAGFTSARLDTATPTIIATNKTAGMKLRIRRITYITGRASSTSNDFVSFSGDILKKTLFCYVGTLLIHVP
jgi:hypothetical protein